MRYPLQTLAYLMLVFAAACGRGTSRLESTFKFTDNQDSDTSGTLLAKIQIDLLLQEAGSPTATTIDKLSDSQLALAADEVTFEGDAKRLTPLTLKRPGEG